MGESESMRATAERVEESSLRQLRDVDIDDVYVHMDYLLEARPTPLDLYHRWERQNWSTQDLDFTQDAAHWAGLAEGFDGVRVELQRSFTLFFVGEQTVGFVLGNICAWHVAEHNGEIPALKGAQGLKGLPF